MKKLILLSLSLCFVMVSFADVKLGDIYIRDPFVIVDNGIYYLYRTADSICADGSVRGGVEVLTSRDLEYWREPTTVMRIPDDNALAGSVWAPEVHKYNGKYYLFATINSDIEFKKRTEGWPPYKLRGTQIFYAESPEGPFIPFSQFTHTPQEQMALDGTLWVENDTPYMVYCHEWVQLADGTIELIELEPDLSATVGAPQVLFYGSAPSWGTGLELRSNLPKCYITDGCYLYRTTEGKLLMIWSTYAYGKYAIGISESTTGSVKGLWRHHDELLFADNGGHAMIFRDLEGKLRLAFHQPNDPAGAERAHFYTIEDTGNSIKIIQ